MYGNSNSKAKKRNLSLKIQKFSNLISNTFRFTNKNIFSHKETAQINTTASNTIYPYISSNNTNSNNTERKPKTETNFYPNKKRNSTELKDHKKIMITLANTMNKIKEKKKQDRIKLLNKNFIIHNKYDKNFLKTLPKFRKKESILKLREISKNKNRYKELKFKIYNMIKINTLPLCSSYINKSHLFNEKLLEYYHSENHINLIKNYNKNFTFNLNLENHPKYKMYTDIKEIESASECKKLDFKKVFTPEEQKLIMLDPAYYFQKDFQNIFTNVNISKKKNLADRIQDEDEEHQIKKILTELMNKKNRKKIKNKRGGMVVSPWDIPWGVSDEIISKINKILSSQEMKNLNPKKIENIDLNNLTPSKTEDDSDIKNDIKNKNFNLLKLYKINTKESNIQAEKLRLLEIEKNNKENKFKLNVQGKLKNCEREINMISRDKLLQKRANEKLYYDKSKDEKNEFNIFTKQMLVEQNYEYIAKHRRKLKDINKASKKNSFENKNDEFDESIRSKNKKKNNNILSENKDKKFINYYINKIKLIYKQQ